MILITYGMKYITMEAVLKASIFARDGASSTMWARVFGKEAHVHVHSIKKRNKIVSTATIVVPNVAPLLL